MGLLRLFSENIRSAIDNEGAAGCFSRSVQMFSRHTGIPAEGLWAAADGVLQGNNRPKMTKRFQKAFGGTTEQWDLWFDIAETKPDCPGGDDV